MSGFLVQREKCPDFFKIKKRNVRISLPKSAKETTKKLRHQCVFSNLHSERVGILKVSYRFLFSYIKEILLLSGTTLENPNWWCYAHNAVLDTGYIRTQSFTRYFLKYRGITATRYFLKYRGITATAVNTAVAVIPPTCFGGRNP